MFRRSFFYQVIILISLILCVSCKQDKGDRTRVRTTDVEIPLRPPSQAMPPDSDPQVPGVELFREACLEGQMEIIEQYINGDMDVTLADEEGRTGLMLSSFNGHTEIVKKLIEEGAEINRTDNMGRTSLMYASTGHFPETVKLLLSAGAETNIVDNDEQFTALMFAGAEGNVEVIRALLKNGADPSLKDKDGDTAESFARENGHEEAADLLKSATESKN